MLIDFYPDLGPDERERIDKYLTNVAKSEAKSLAYARAIETAWLAGEDIPNIKKGASPWPRKDRRDWPLLALAVVELVDSGKRGVTSPRLIRSTGRISGFTGTLSRLNFIGFAERLIDPRV